MKKIWEVIKRFFGWKPKVIPTPPVNNFDDWSEDEMQIATFINIVREQSKPLSMIRKIGGVFYSPLNVVPDLTPNKLCWEESVKRCIVQHGRENISHEGVGKAFAALTGAGYTSPAEILAYGYSSPESVVEAWYKSESHRKIVLGTKYKYFGVGQTIHNNKKYYCILFCK